MEYWKLEEVADWLRDHGLSDLIQTFEDLCILLGCDYCESIRGIGPKRAIDLIKQYKCIEEIIKHLDTKKYTIPENWMYKEARELFKAPDVTEADKLELKWTEPKVEELIDYMVKQKQFSEDRIRNGTKRLTKARTGSTQGRLDGFFTVLSPSSTTKKRKSEEPKGSAKKKAKGTFKKGK